MGWVKKIIIIRSGVDKNGVNRFTRRGPRLPFSYRFSAKNPKKKLINDFQKKTGEPVHAVLFHIAIKVKAPSITYKSFIKIQDPKSDHFS